MKPPFAYYGGKSRLAPWIASLLPAHRVYVEPFAGSAAVLFAKTPCQHEVINDASRGVINFFKMLRERPDDLERLCALTPYARDEFESECADWDTADVDDLERARRWWARSTQGFGQQVTKTGWSISLDQNVNRPHSLMRRIERFAASADRLRGVFVENLHAFDCIERYGVADAVIYCDPPYLNETRASMRDECGGFTRRPSGDYEVEFNTPEEHRDLADVLKATPATVLLSGYESPLYDELYREWWRTERTVIAHSSNGITKKPRPKRIEVIWSNRPINDGRLDLEEVALA